MKGHAIRAYKFVRSTNDPACGNLGLNIPTCHIMYIAGGGTPSTARQRRAGSRQQGRGAVVVDA